MHYRGFYDWLNVSTLLLHLINGSSLTASLTERHSRLSFIYFSYFWTNCSYSHYSIFSTSESGNCFYENHHIYFYLVNTNIHYYNKYLSLILWSFSKDDNELTSHLFQYPRNDSYSKCSFKKIRQEIQNLKNIGGFVWRKSHLCNSVQ